MTVMNAGHVVGRMSPPSRGLLASSASFQVDRNHPMLRTDFRQVDIARQVRVSVYNHSTLSTLPQHETLWVSDSQGRLFLMGQFV